MVIMRSPMIRILLAVLALCGVMSSQAEARVFIGLGLPLYVGPPPIVVPPPYYYAPYYAAPPTVYTPPGYAPPAGQPQSLAPQQSYPQNNYPSGQNYTPSQGYATPPGGYTPSIGMAPAGGSQACRAGAYVCPLVEDTPPGGECACPGHDGQRIRGRAS
jgi:hypothetical protein